MPTQTLNSTLSPNAFYALLAVVDQDLHGYGIRDQIVKDSSSQLILAPSAIYPLLDRLVKAGLLERRDSHYQNSGSVTHVYHLSAQGRKHLEVEVHRLENAVTNAKFKLGQKLF